ncbi:hypothetical protein [Faecalispora jeddahensis]|uniref:hypothetical protein n=1 Tax=Faecalispora jeddahensis TaxID=1414721 RepID=UPI0004B58A88|nr:hypothetical protein [Faecalispora jeddahensis]
MEKLVSYLETLGYTVEEQGRIQKFLIVFYQGLPVGFILPDFSVRLVTDADGVQRESLGKIVAFFQEHNNLPSVGSGEFMILNYRGNQLTVFFHPKHQRIQYASYTVSPETGETQRNLYMNYDTAIHHFIEQTHMINLHEPYSLPRKTLSERFSEWLLQYLLKKSQEKLEQS